MKTLIYRLVISRSNLVIELLTNISLIKNYKRDDLKKIEMTKLANIKFRIYSISRIYKDVKYLIKIMRPK